MKRRAPAKVNLALHVTGQRDDGYHLLDSIVVFADVGDVLTVEPAETLSLAVTGPRGAGVPHDRRNLVWQAAEAFGTARGAAITLDKHLPHAGGIGGGSADAAATLHALADLWEIPLPDAATVLGLGADVPVCLHGRACRMSGIGERITDIPPLPPLWLVLVNPGVDVPTGPVFDALGCKDNSPLPETAWKDPTDFIAWLAGSTRNDLQPPACALVPEIGTVLDSLSAQDGCGLARMSGSGGTCFGLFTRESEAADAAAAIQSSHPAWWVSASRLLD